VCERERERERGSNSVYFLQLWFVDRKLIMITKVDEYSEEDFRREVWEDF
jgi:hypothetical protein